MSKECCQSSNKEIKGGYCPVCSAQGEKVSTKTVRSLVFDKDNVINNIDYYLCLHPQCDVAYFTRREECILKHDIKVPIWYKNGASPKYICYCSEVTEEVIVDAINSKNLKSVKEVVEHTDAMNISNCIENSPTGKCCSRQIKELISTT